MADKPIFEQTDAEVVETAGSRVIGTDSGTKAQEAQAEISRRLIVALRESKESADSYAKVLTYFTGLLFIIALAQLSLSGITLPGIPFLARIIGTVILDAFVVGCGAWIFIELQTDK